MGARWSATVHRERTGGPAASPQCPPVPSWRGVNSIAAAGDPRQWSRARTPSRRSCPTSPTSSATPGSGSATSRRQCHRHRAPGLARAAHDDDQRQRQLPANATATIGQTSLLGSLHIELAPPKDVAPQGTLHEGSLIPLTSGAALPSTEQTLASVSLAAQRRRHRSDPGHHAGAQYRVRWPRERPP